MDADGTNPIRGKFRWLTNILTLGAEDQASALLTALAERMGGGLGTAISMPGPNANVPFGELCEIADLLSDADALIAILPLNRWEMFVLGSALARQVPVIGIRRYGPPVNHPLVADLQEGPLVLDDPTDRTRVRTEQRADRVMRVLNAWGMTDGPAELTEVLLRAADEGGRLGPVLVGEA